MPSTTIAVAPGLSSFLKDMKNHAVDANIEHFISLLKRRQIRNSRPCAIATATLLRNVVTEFREKDVVKLLDRIRRVGQRLTAAQPREMAVGNIVRRVLGLIREIAEEGADADNSDAGQFSPPHLTQTHNDSLHRPALSSHISTMSPLRHVATQPQENTFHRSESSTSSEGTDEREDGLGALPRRPPLSTSLTSGAASSANTSLFGLLSSVNTPSPMATPPAGYQTPNSTGKPTLTAHNLTGLGDSSLSYKNIKDDVYQGIDELLDELDQVDEQIAAYALDHIHSNEIILTHTSSQTVQKFLLTAAKKRKFTVVHAEAFPNDHDDTHATIMTGRKGADEESDTNDFFKPLTAAGITVILIPDSAIFAIMSRVNKVILATHTVLANGGLVAAAGARMIAKAAKMHQTPVVVVSGVYKLSPVYPFDVEELIEYGDAGKVVGYDEGDLVEKIDVINPLFDYVPADLVDLYITNLGGHAPSYLYRIVADHYRVEDINL